MSGGEPAGPGGEDRRRRRHALLAGLLFLGALGLRIAYVRALAATPAGRYLLIDSAFYAERAHRIAAGLGWGQEPYFMNPLYAYLLAPLAPWTAGGPLRVGLVQAVLGAATVVLIAWLARRWFGDLAACLAGVLAAFYGPLWFYDGALLTATPILAASAAMLVGLERWSDTRGRGWPLLAGGLGGLAALLRPTALLFVAVAPLCVELARSARAAGARLPGRAVARGTLLVGVACAAVLAPAVVRNLVVGGEAVLTTSVGMNFYTGNQPGATGIYDGAPFVTSFEPRFERADFQREAERRRGTSLSPVAASRFWLGEGLRAIAADPLAWLQLEARKLWLVLHPVEAQNNLSLYVVRDWVPLLRWNPFGFRLLAPLGIAGLVLHWRRRRRLAVPLAFAAAHVVAMLVFFVSSEYRLPLVLVLLPAAGAALAAAIQRWRGRVVPAGRAAVVAAVVVVVAASIETPLTRRLTAKRVDYLNFATLAEGAGEPGEALALLARALAIDPHYRPALARQAALAERVGLPAVARRARARLADLAPPARDEVQLWDVDRAVGLYQAGRYQEALDVFAALAPGTRERPRIDNNIGLCLYKLGRLEEAERVLRAVVAETPGYLRARHNLALVLRAQGRTPEAVDVLRALVAVAPDHWRSRLELVEWAVEDGALARARAEVAELEAARAPPAVIAHARELLTADDQTP
ncbi:MAG: tetratricopeptide repeat protein [Candidatus Eiseniibacteriota bacterium]